MIRVKGKGPISNTQIIERKMTALGLQVRGYA